jgi:membrane-associated phospholipid phosphatase
LKDLNISTQGELKEHLDNRFSIDDFSQYSPALAVYALDAAGVKAKHRLADRTLVLGTAYFIMGTTVNVLKITGRVQRPDGSSTNSFPSGHTATVFMGAEFLYQEYKDRSAWYGIAGYAVATSTGLFRMFNNRHWLTDVAAGAGIGILSTKFAYLLYPYLRRKLFPRRTGLNGMLFPVSNGASYGLGMIVNF